MAVDGPSSVGVEDRAGRCEHHLRATAERFTTQLRGQVALEHGDAAVGGVGVLDGADQLRVGGLTTPSRFSARVFPVQVSTLVSSRPFFVSSFMTAYTPPAPSRSSI